MKLRLISEWRPKSWLDIGHDSYHGKEGANDIVWFYLPNDGFIEFKGEQNIAHGSLRNAHLHGKEAAEVYGRIDQNTNEGSIGFKYGYIHPSKKEKLVDKITSRWPDVHFWIRDEQGGKFVDINEWYKQLFGESTIREYRHLTWKEIGHGSFNAAEGADDIIWFYIPEEGGFIEYPGKRKLTHKELLDKYYPNVKYPAAWGRVDNIKNEGSLQFPISFANRRKVKERIADLVTKRWPDIDFWVQEGRGRPLMTINQWYQDLFK